jgi:FkbM family methyltransferase
MNIPIIVICYNNYKYVNNTLIQIQKINEEYYKNIIIVNNNSTCIDTINFLNNVNVKIINNENNGPWISNVKNKHIYDSLPDKFILTDPDLKFNENIPSNFIEILSELSDKYNTTKIGFALDITDFEKMYDTIYVFSIYTIYDWEKRFWANKFDNDIYELYNAEIDTTFCLINKKNIYTNFCIRIAGNFTAKHLPWYKEPKIMSIYENYVHNTNSTDISTISKLIILYIENNYLKINKNNEQFLIKNNNPNLTFWKDIYSNWENDTFNVFDKYLSKDKIFIDIGGWIGTTTMYGSRKSQKVYSIDANNDSFNDMIQTNCINNYTLINKVIYNIDNIKIKIGKNKFLSDSELNDSTSQIYNENGNSDDLAETITLESIITNYQINPREISLIKVDISGGEENILNDLISIHNKYNTPIYVKFRYTWWNDPDLDRFNFLTATQKDDIKAYPFTCILFENKI